MRSVIYGIALKLNGGIEKIVYSYAEPPFTFVPASQKKHLYGDCKLQLRPPLIFQGLYFIQILFGDGSELILLILMTNNFG